MATGIISCPLYQSTYYSFKPDYAMVTYMKDHNIQSDRTEKEMGTVKLKFLYLRLALSDHIISPELDDESNGVIDSSLILVANDEPGLSDDLVQKMELTLKSDSKQEEILAQAQAYEQSDNFETIRTSAFLDGEMARWMLRSRGDGGLIVSLGLRVRVRARDQEQAFPVGRMRSTWWGSMVFHGDLSLCTTDWPYASLHNGYTKHN